MKNVFGIYPRMKGIGNFRTLFLREYFFPICNNKINSHTVFAFSAIHENASSCAGKKHEKQFEWIVLSPLIIAFYKRIKEKQLHYSTE